MSPARQHDASIEGREQRLRQQSQAQDFVPYFSESDIDVLGDDLIMKIRPACCDDTAAMARVRVDAWKVSFRNIVPDWYLDLLSYELTERQWHKNLWEEDKGGQAFVVENELGEVVGTAICGPARYEEDYELLKDYRGEIYVLYVLPTFQRQGAGRALMHACAHALSEGGHTPFFVWTFEDSPARLFYETLGGIQIAEKEVEYGGKQLMEVCYGWTN